MKRTKGNEMTLACLAIVTAVLLVGEAARADPGTIYVDADAPGPTHDGSSWTRAYNYLHHALGNASPGDEIWVAHGVYAPTTWPRGFTGRTAAFALKNGVAIRGGYSGYGTANPNARNITAYETILSGNIGRPDDDTDDCYHVVTARECDRSAVLDGFTITRGNANGSSQQSHNRGGGMYADGPTVLNCIFRGNSAEQGGALFHNKGTPRVTDCIFIDNSASSHGGGMYNWSMSTATVMNCAFIENSADKGGGMYNASSNPIVTNCLFSGNWANVGGGIDNARIVFGGGSHPTLTNCTFLENSTGSLGGGLSNEFWSSPKVTNCIFWGNSDARVLLDEAAQIHNAGGDPDVSYSCIQGWTGTLGGVGNTGADPRFADADGRLWSTSPCIDAGSNAAVAANITTDLDGNRRIRNGTVDMGAYEYGGYHVRDVDLSDLGEFHQGFAPRRIVSTGSPKALAIWSVLKNDGTEESGPFKIRFFLSRDTTIDPRDDSLVDEADISSIAGGQTFSFRWEGEISEELQELNLAHPGFAGVYVGWIIDAYDAVAETNESNNTACKEGYRLVIDIP